MTISDADECDAALAEMGGLLDERPPLDSPKGRRLLWLAKEVKDYLLDIAGPGFEPQKAITRMLWADIDDMLSGWGGLP